MNPKALIESKIASYLGSQSSLNFPVQRGQTSDGKVCPVIIVYAVSAKAAPEIPDCDENYLIELKVTVISSAQDLDEDAHQAEVAEVKNLLRDVPALKETFDPGTEGILYDLWQIDDQEGKDDNDYGNSILYSVAMVGPVDV
jgi:hypothetical protein